MRRFLLLVYVFVITSFGTIVSAQNSALEWRGLMIDVSRHYMPMEFLYKQIDAMEHFGLNRLHLHLTDAAGWRMEIKSRPRLCNVGAWRTARSWQEWWEGDKAYSNSRHGYGGYYTQDELRAFVAYAAQRGVEVVPEIEFPAHSEEVVAAYPEVGFKDYGEMDMQKEETYALMRDVLTEVAEVFPTKYIHVGGDEAATQHDTQPEGMRRIKQILDSLGRRMIVWDEALTDEPRDSDVIIMVWRDIETAQKAARLGHDVILSPAKWCYLDKSQEDISKGARTQGGYLSVDKVYTLPNPFTTEAEKKHLLGIQANLWTEYVETQERAECMIWPRAFAIAELGRIGLDTPRDDAKTFHKKAVEATRWLHAHGYNAFDLEHASSDHSLPVLFKKGLKITGVEYNNKYSGKYSADGDMSLFDGKAGSYDFSEGWLGFIGKEGMDVTIDLGKVKKIKTISADFLQTVGPQIYYPYHVTIEISLDGNNFNNLSVNDYPDDYAQKDGAKVMSWTGKTLTRYIRIKALPGEKEGWIFCDEIMIK